MLIKLPKLNQVSEQTNKQKGFITRAIFSNFIVETAIDFSGILLNSGNFAKKSRKTTLVIPVKIKRK